ncbi:MAG: type II toxin-antitoxin system VapC family toxin [Acidobacteria bacterium]|nr:type II toxin-antitoxin system VapC family toxin [Acidobacteriota bacterium]MSO62962.1 type II toxin-antitoxin system VapC family toxin [Acidobacteriota bacterium]
MEYALDTNACIALINGSSVPVRRRFKDVLAEGSVVCVSTVAVHELWYGVAKSERRDYNTERLQAFLSGPIRLMPFDEADARAAGEVRALLEQERRPIGAYDSLLAGQAARRGMTLVTANVREFERVDGLMWEDWSVAVWPAEGGE